MRGLLVLAWIALGASTLLHAASFAGAEGSTVGWTVVVLSILVFILWIPAFMGHPARQIHGTTVVVGWRDFVKHCPKYLLGMMVVVMIYAVVTLYALPIDEVEGHQVIEPTPIELRFMSAMLMLFHAVSVGMVASTAAARKLHMILPP